MADQSPILGNVIELVTQSLAFGAFGALALSEIGPKGELESNSAFRPPLFGVEREPFTLRLMGNSQRETPPEPHGDGRVCNQPFGSSINGHRHRVRGLGLVHRPIPHVGDDDDLFVPTGLAHLPGPTHAHMSGPDPRQHLHTLTNGPSLVEIDP